MKIKLFILFFSIVIALFVGNRDISIGKDTLNYYYFYSNVSSNNMEYIRIPEPLFIHFSKFFSYIGLSFNFFLVAVSFISIYLLLYVFVLFIEKFNFSKDKETIIVIVLCFFLMLTPFFWSSQINVIRSGIAIPFLFFSIYFLINRNLILFVIFSLISIMFHYSIVLYIIFFMMFFIFKKYFYHIYILIISFYLVGLNEIIYKKILGILNVDTMYMSYLDGETSMDIYKSGVRYDFSLFTLFFIGLFFLIKIKFNKDFPDSLFKCACILTIPFFLLGTIPFSDRLLLPFWLLIPFIASTFILVCFENKNYYSIITVISFFGIFLSFYFSVISYGVI